MSASHTIQAASIFYLDKLLATAPALYTSSCLLFWLHFSTLTFSAITIVWVSGFVVFNSFLKAVGEALHSLFCISFSEFAGTSTNSTVSYLVSLCLVSVALFSCLQFQPIFYFINIFSTHMFLIFHMSLQDEDKGGAFHIKSYFSLSSFAGMYTHRHSVLKGPWQFPFPVLVGLKVPVIKWNLLQDVVGTFLPGGNCRQEAFIISSDHTMPHYRRQIFIKLSPLQF